MEGNEMKKIASEPSYIMDWELSHLGDDEFDAELVKFPGWQNIVRLASNANHQLPEKITFEANFRTLATSDFPYNDVHWPLMSKEMLEILLSVGDFPHRAIPVVMVKDTVATEERYDEHGKAKSGVEDDTFVAIQLLQHLEALDWERSELKRDEDLPNRVDRIKKLVLKEPASGVPPIFRLSAYPIPLFVSHAAREALEKDHIRGMKFESIGDFRG